MEVKPSTIPHDRDDGPEPKPVTDETTTPDGEEAVTGDPPTEVTRVQRNPDGTEVLVPAGGKVVKEKSGGKVV